MLLEKYLPGIKMPGCILILWLFVTTVSWIFFVVISIFIHDRFIILIFLVLTCIFVERGFITVSFLILARIVIEN